MTHRLRHGWLPVLILTVALTGSPSDQGVVTAAPLDQYTTWAVVSKPHGAAIRSSPRSDDGRNIYFVADCGDSFIVIGNNGPWLQIYVYGDPYGRENFDAWIGGARVQTGVMAPRVNCDGAMTFQMGTRVATSVPTGCLSLRERPSRDAPYHHCVPNGFQYFITNGPLEVNGEDWFEVVSRQTGEGWVLAEFLYPDY